MAFVTRLRGLLRRRGPAVGSEETFWDDYVRTLRSSNGHRPSPYIGSDWGNEEGFLFVLRQHAAPGQMALEIGCGGGRITAVAAGLFAHVHAADVSQEMLRECATAITARNVSFQKLDGHTLKEFADESLDCVYSHDVFVHFASVDTYWYLAEIIRVLKPAGIGVLSFYDFVTRFDLFKQTSVQRRTVRQGRRLHFVTEEMIRVMLADVGAELVDMHRRAFLTTVFRKAR